MVPDVRLYRKDDATFRTIRRTTDTGVEVLVLGSSGERAHHTFASGSEADQFRQSFELFIARRGFRLAWATTTS